MLAQMMTQFPEETAGELREVLKEAFGNGRLDQITAEVMVKHYSTEEILELARFMATPEAQSTIRKQPLILAETMKFSQAEILRVLRKRHPELFADEPNRIAGQFPPAGMIETGGTPTPSGSDEGR